MNRRRHARRTVVGGYRLPVPLRDEDDWKRGKCFDLRRLGTTSVWQEKLALERALACLSPYGEDERRYARIEFGFASESLSAQEWLVWRYECVCDELKRRRDASVRS